MTATPAGARLLAERLASPLTDPQEINERLDALAFLVEAPALREALRKTLAAAPDFLRALSRLSLDRGGPRDLAALRDGLAASAAIAETLGAAEALPPALLRCLARLERQRRRPRARSRPRRSPTNCRSTSATAASCAPALCAPLDEARRLRDESRRVVAEMQARYAEEAGTRQLKIKHNNFLGYYIETPQAQGEALLKAPHSATFIHRQTMAGAMRFTTNALIDLEARIASAADRALALELEIFERLRQACLAQTRNAARPRRRARRDRRRRRARRTRGQARLGRGPMSTTSLAFAIEGGRHPVVEAALAAARRAVRRQRLRPLGRAGGGRAHRAGDRPQHGGQVDLSAPERADRGARADGRLRAGAARPYRRRRPAVLARRRRRRSRARPLDLHGRDGRDGGDPQSGDRALARHSRRDRPRHRDLRRPFDRLRLRRASQRGQPLAHAVRDPFPRTDPALPDAAAPLQPDDAGQRVEGRAGLPARSRSPARRIVPTASRSPSSPGSPPR